MEGRFNPELFMKKVMKYSITNGRVLSDSKFNQLVQKTMNQCECGDISSAIDEACEILEKNKYSPRPKKLGGFEIPLEFYRYR